MKPLMGSRCTCFGSASWLVPSSSIERRAFADFSANGSADEIAGFMRAVGKIAKDLGLEAQGYRLLTNMGEHGGQEVPHFHVHLFAGRPLGRMLSG